MLEQNQTAEIREFRGQLTYLGLELSMASPDNIRQSRVKREQEPSSSIRRFV